MQASEDVELGVELAFRFVSLRRGSARLGGGGKERADLLTKSVLVVSLHGEKLGFVLLRDARLGLGFDDDDLHLSLE